MGAHFNIENAETVELAERLAQHLGSSVSDAIHQALEEKLRAAAHAKPSVDEALTMLHGVRHFWKPEFDGQELSITHGDLLYDERGLPK